MPEIIDVLVELKNLAKGGEHDLAESAVEKLMAAGLLFVDGEEPKRPDYICRLNEDLWKLVPKSATLVQQSDDQLSLLEVNPLVYLQTDDEPPEDIRDEVFSLPVARSYPICWVRDAGTNILEPYWLDESMYELLCHMSQGNGLPNNASPLAVRLLTQANILVAPDFVQSQREAWDAICRQAETELAKNNYAILRKILNPLQISSLRSYSRELQAQGFFTVGDDQVPLRNHYCCEPLFSRFHRPIAELINRFASEQIKPSYSLLVAYQPKAILRRHKDREQHTLNLSFVIDMGPDEQHEEPWPFFVEPMETDEVIQCFRQPDRIEANPDRHEILLQMGEGVLYSGKRLAHARNELPEPRTTSICIYGFVDHDYDGPLH
jgi:hypothetical protein